MSEIDRLIRKAFVSKKKGITLWPRQEGGFQANVQHEDGSWTVEMDDMPDEALLKALNTALAFPRHRTPPKPGANRPEAKRRRDIEDLA
ncbi:hypothetical protein ABDF71_21780 [Ochrobactrum sp. WV_118_8]